ncbi:Twinkle-like protein [Nymphaea thermarum]|nr:Twinkle-like protein [Nymphaea thermarum]
MFGRVPGIVEVLNKIGFTTLTLVEGEIDKLSMEEAGFLNCVSVPDGAPPRVSEKELPSWEQLGKEY